MNGPHRADRPAGRAAGSAAPQRDRHLSRPAASFRGTGVARVTALSVITAWVLAGLVASESMVQFLGYPAISLLPPAKWPAFLALGGLAGLAGCERRSLVTGSILALGLLVAILRLPTPVTFSIVTSTFVLGLAAMAGLGAGRTAVLLIERRHSAPDANSGIVQSQPADGYPASQT